MKRSITAYVFVIDYDFILCSVFLYRSCTDVLEMEVVATEDIQDVRNQVKYMLAPRFSSCSVPLSH